MHTNNFNIFNRLAKNLNSTNLSMLRHSVIAELRRRRSTVRRHCSACPVLMTAPVANRFGFFSGALTIQQPLSVCWILEEWRIREQEQRAGRKHGNDSRGHTWFGEGNVLAMVGNTGSTSLYFTY
jgi:hypothetical protein